MLSLNPNSPHPHPVCCFHYQDHSSSTSVLVTCDYWEVVRKRVVNRKSPEIRFSPHFNDFSHIFVQLSSFMNSIYCLSFEGRGGREEGYTMDWSPEYHRADIQKHTFTPKSATSQTPVCTSLDKLHTPRPWPTSDFEGELCCEPTTLPLIRLLSTKNNNLACSSKHSSDDKYQFSVEMEARSTSN